MAKPVRGSSASWAAYANKNKRKEGPDTDKIIHQIDKNMWLAKTGGLKRGRRPTAPSTSGTAGLSNLINDPLGELGKLMGLGKNKRRRH